MYEIVTNQTQIPVVALLEARVETCYLATGSYEHRRNNDASVVSLSSTQDAFKRDQLRHYVTHSEDGFYLDIRFTHNEFEFVDAISKWLSRLTTQLLSAFPDLAELVINEFRLGMPMEALPVSKLKAYSDRWESSLWENIQAYKKISRDLHEHYQQALKHWDAEQSV
ncbi:hypothetical protein [Litoribrevibacter albus]|uniref:Uncharacterized protein n=1 Tax=Litoribrevibacter albus TaxID=1473156 RepID=A0AA37S974_9GAMM|nr:hypothetical protein [Litoribrevibacter albus]GLQ30499.1 hypothetical protein GCM10007876_09770 [Litoribrevibacter albus]